MSIFDLFNRESYTSSSDYGSSSSAPTIGPRYIAPTPAEIAAAVAPTKYAPVDLTKYSCDDPYDLEDLYYYLSPKNGQKGPYIPQPTDYDIRYSARIRDGRTIWTQRTIPNTSATGCMSQDLGGYFGVMVDGLNKVVIDAYNAQFPNPPTPVPLKTKYFYYTRFINNNVDAFKNKDEHYFPARFTMSFRKSLTLNKNSKIRCDDLISDACWGELQKLPNTNAMGFVITRMYPDGAYIYVRVDAANNAIIDAYNKSLNTPLPPGVPQPSYFYYTRFINNNVDAFKNKDKYYEPITPANMGSKPMFRNLFIDYPGIKIRCDGPNRDACCDLLSDACWGEPQKIPDTNAIGFMITRMYTGGTQIYVRVDRANNAIIEAYNESLNPLPPGWKELRANTGRVYYRNPALDIVQYARPVNLPPGWEELKDPSSGRIYYGNPALKIVQYDFPAPPSSTSAPAPPSPAPPSASSAPTPPSSSSSAPALPSSTSPVAAPPPAAPVPAPSLSNNVNDTLPSGWVKHVDAKGRSFYFNEESNKKQWELPLSNPAPAPSSSNNVNDTLPPGWVKHVDAKGRSFYFNEESNKKQWELPSSPAPLSNPAPAPPIAPTNQLPLTSSQPMVPVPALLSNPAQPAPASTPLPPGWEELREPSGRVYYGNPALKIIQYARPMLFKMSGRTFSSMNELMHMIYSSCPPGASECEVEAAPAAPATPSAAGGAKNKKCGTKRRRHRRKASRRSTSKK